MKDFTRAGIRENAQVKVSCFFFLFFFLILFTYLWQCWVFVSVRGLSLVVASGGLLFIAVRGPLTVAASLVAEHRLQTRRLSSCGSQAQSLRGMWDLPRPGLEPVCPALAGRFSTTAPPGKPLFFLFKKTPPHFNIHLNNQDYHTDSQPIRIHAEHSLIFRDRLLL